MTCNHEIERAEEKVPEAVEYAITHGCVGNMVDRITYRLMKEAKNQHDAINAKCLHDAICEGFAMAHRLRSGEAKGEDEESAVYRVFQNYVGPAEGDQHIKGLLREAYRAGQASRDQFRDGTKMVADVTDTDSGPDVAAASMEALDKWSKENKWDTTTANTEAGPVRVPIEKHADDMAEVNAHARESLIADLKSRIPDAVFAHWKKKNLGGTECAFFFRSEMERTMAELLESVAHPPMSDEEVAPAPSAPGMTEQPQKPGDVREHRWGCPSQNLPPTGACDCVGYEYGIAHGRQRQLEELRGRVDEVGQWAAVAFNIGLPTTEMIIHKLLNVGANG